MNVVKIKQTTVTKFSVIKRGASLSQIASGGADEAVTPYSFPFIFQAYPPTIKPIVVSPVDTSLLILEIR